MGAFYAGGAQYPGAAEGQGGKGGKVCRSLLLQMPGNKDAGSGQTAQGVGGDIRVAQGRHQDAVMLLAAAANQLPHRPGSGFKLLRPPLKALGQVQRIIFTQGFTQRLGTRLIENLHRHQFQPVKLLPGGDDPLLFRQLPGAAVKLAEALGGNVGSALIQHKSNLQISRYSVL